MENPLFAYFLLSSCKCCQASLHYLSLPFNRAGPANPGIEQCILDYIAYAVDTRAYQVRVYLNHKRTETSRKCAQTEQFSQSSTPPVPRYDLEISEDFTA